MISDMRAKKDWATVVKEVFREKRYVRNAAFNSPESSGRRVLSYGATRNLVVALRRDGLIQAAGKGWSTAKARGRFAYNEPVVELTQCLAEWFPYAEKPCWSTHQLVDLFHHLPGTFYAYVYIDRSVMELLRDRIEDRWPRRCVLVDPGMTEFRSARKAEENVVIRPITHDDEADNQLYLPIEAILVDLAYEAEFIMDGWDYGEVVRNVLSTYTIDPQVILRRISRRRFASGNMVTLCEALFREGVESGSVRALYSALKKGEAG